MHQRVADESIYVSQSIYVNESIYVMSMKAGLNMTHNVSNSYSPPLTAYSNQIIFFNNSLVKSFENPIIAQSLIYLTIVPRN